MQIKRSTIAIRRRRRRSSIRPDCRPTFWTWSNKIMLKIYMLLFCYQIWRSKVRQWLLRQRYISTKGEVQFQIPSLFLSGFRDCFLFSSVMLQNKLTSENIASWANVLNHSRSLCLLLLWKYSRKSSKDFCIILLLCIPFTQFPSIKLHKILSFTKVPIIFRSEGKVQCSWILYFRLLYTLFNLETFKGWALIL